uniref:Variant surface glycoprotein 1798 n=1 Tax=Trypanosoma brucei TaxID=5691 RepID=M4T108_9TRYP|nr:variant surface glycoprotein 1798 [Trypanosoma brucei]
MRAELALLTAITITTATETEEAIKYTLWSRQCKLAKMLKSSSKNAAAQLSATRSNINTLTLTATKLEIYALARPADGKARAATALALAAEAAAAAQLIKLKQQTDKAIKAVGYGHAGAAFITGFYQLLASNDNSNNAYCLDSSGGNANGAGEMTTLGCSATSDNVFVAGPGPDPGDLQATGFAHNDEVTSTSGQGTRSKCGFLKTAATLQSNAGFYSTRPANDKGLAHGLLTLNGANNPIAPALTDLSGKADDPALGFWHKAHAAAQAAANEKSITINNDETQRLKDLAR